MGDGDGDGGVSTASLGQGVDGDGDGDGGVSKASLGQGIDGDGDDDGGVSKSSYNATRGASDTVSISEISTHDVTNFGENSTLVRTQKGRPCVRDNVCLCDAKISWGEPEDCCKFPPSRDSNGILSQKLRVRSIYLILILQ